MMVFVQTGRDQDESGGLSTVQLLIPAIAGAYGCFCTRPQDSDWTAESQPLDKQKDSKRMLQTD